MGTTRIKVLDLSSDKVEVKTSRKHAAKIKPQVETEDTVSKSVSEESAEENVQEPKKKRESKKREKLKNLRHAGKKYKTATERIEKDKVYSQAEALKLLEETSFTKFDPTVEIYLNVNEKNLRGQVNFPHPIGPKKEKKYLVFANNFKTENKNVIMATDDTIEEILDGKLKPVKDFDVVIASASFMPNLVKIAKILGPSGMMPNPKNGTITNNPQSIFEGKVSDSFEFRSDPTAPIIHIKLGKLSSKEAKIKANLNALITAVGSTKIKKAIIKTTMSPGIRIDVAQIQ